MSAMNVSHLLVINNNAFGSQGPYLPLAHSSSRCIWCPVAGPQRRFRTLGCLRCQTWTPHSGDQEQRNKCPCPRHTFPSQKLKGKSHANLPISHFQRSPRLQDNTSAPAGSPRILLLQGGHSYLRFQGLRDNCSTRHLLLTGVTALCEVTFRHFPLSQSAASWHGVTLQPHVKVGCKHQLWGPPSSDWQEEGNQPL